MAQNESVTRMSADDADVQRAWNRQFQAMERATAAIQRLGSRGAAAARQSTSSWAMLPIALNQGIELARKLSQAMTEAMAASARQQAQQAQGALSEAKALAALATELKMDPLSIDFSKVHADVLGLEKRFGSLEKVIAAVKAVAEGGFEDFAPTRVAEPGGVAEQLLKFQRATGFEGDLGQLRDEVSRMVVSQRDQAGKPLAKNVANMRQELIKLAVASKKDFEAEDITALARVMPSLVERGADPDEVRAVFAALREKHGPAQARKALEGISSGLEKVSQPGPKSQAEAILGGMRGEELDVRKHGLGGVLERLAERADESKRLGETRGKLFLKSMEDVFSEGTATILSGLKGFGPVVAESIRAQRRPEREAEFEADVQRAEKGLAFEQETAAVETRQSLSDKRAAEGELLRQKWAAAMRKRLPAITVETVAGKDATDISSYMVRNLQMGVAPEQAAREAAQGRVTVRDGTWKAAALAIKENVEDFFNLSKLTITDEERKIAEEELNRIFAEGFPGRAFAPKPEQSRLQFLEEKKKQEGGLEPIYERERKQLEKDAAVRQRDREREEERQRAANAAAQNPPTTGQAANRAALGMVHPILPAVRDKLLPKGVRDPGELAVDVVEGLLSGTKTLDDVRKQREREAAAAQQWEKGRAVAPQNQAEVARRLKEDQNAADALRAYIAEAPHRTARGNIYYSRRTNETFEALPDWLKKSVGHPADNRLTSKPAAEAELRKIQERIREAEVELDPNKARRLMGHEGLPSNLKSLLPDVLATPPDDQAARARREQEQRAKEQAALDRSEAALKRLLEQRGRVTLRDVSDVTEPLKELGDSPERSELLRDLDRIAGSFPRQAERDRLQRLFDAVKARKDAAKMAPKAGFPKLTGDELPPLELPKAREFSRDEPPPKRTPQPAKPTPTIEPATKPATPKKPEKATFEPIEQPPPKLKLDDGGAAALWQRVLREVAHMRTMPETPARDERIEELLAKAPPAREGGDPFAPEKLPLREEATPTRRPPRTEKEAFTAPEKPPLREEATPTRRPPITDKEAFAREREPEPVAKSEPRLVLVGGGKRPPEALEEFSRMTGGKDGRIVAVPWSTQYPAEAVEKFASEMAPHGSKVESAPTFEQMQDDPAAAERFLKQLKSASGIFFTGGDQARHMAILDKYPKIKEQIKALVAGGLPYMGTSAGTAIASDTMILDDKNIGRGLGVLPKELGVDQHFFERHREERLKAAVKKAGLLGGLGIDENSAWLFQGGKARILGPRDARGAIMRRGGEEDTLRFGEELDLGTLRKKPSAPPREPAAEEPKPTPVLWTKEKLDRIVNAVAGELPKAAKAFNEAGGDQEKLLERGDYPGSPSVVVPSTAERVVPGAMKSLPFVESEDLQKRVMYEAVWKLIQREVKASRAKTVEDVQRALDKVFNELKGYSGFGATEKQDLEFDLGLRKEPYTDRSGDYRQGWKLSMPSAEDLPAPARRPLVAPPPIARDIPRQPDVRDLAASRREQPRSDGEITRQLTAQTALLAQIARAMSQPTAFPTRLEVRLKHGGREHDAEAHPIRQLSRSG